MKSYTPTQTLHTWLLIAILVTALSVLFVVSVPYLCRRRNHQPMGSSRTGGTCGASCSAIDPVNDPDYNMRNVVKQSILLEEHLAETNKYCEPCIVKHFLHIIGLVEEGVWLAGSSSGKYPHLNDSVAFYETAFQKWQAARLADGGKEAAAKEALDVLRGRRRELVEAYFLS